ncbi:phosphatidylserine decarboxylase [Clostridium sp. 29_15]|uniref:phosphatidylserine decarboxylase n=1 Tax=Clostridium sp. 29_15 TaxID=1896982 RepID=UPI0009591728|nr:phosphatidylserine decarboxylase [Clostridium sp. 29_15]OKZ86673.1 MAG: phosphatidylserine decarboxylase [Clostridium sp. 29_15]
MIRIYNRKTGKYDIEKVAGEKYIKWTYESPLGKSLLELFIKRKLFSKIYGFYCNTKFSKRKIKSFINSFSIDMSKCADSINTYKSFNDFFIRKLLPEARPFDKNSNTLISPGDGRLLAYTNISMENLVQVKNIHYSLAELLEDNALAKEYEGGTCLVLRLCPTDYHRFHFIDNGVPLENHFIKGNYYSVNPTALERVAKLYCQNKREWSIFKSENFGDIIHVEVGATCVGSIIQSYCPNKKVSKGDEKGYFKFGGSTTILFFKPNTVDIDEDIIIQSSLGFETAVQMGEKIGVKWPSTI